MFTCWVLVRVMFYSLIVFDFVSWFVLLLLFCVFALLVVLVNLYYLLVLMC